MSETCAACGDDHVDTATGTRIGVSWIARECSWVLRWPGRQAHEVIELLEKRLGEEPPPSVNGGVEVDALVREGMLERETPEPEDPQATTEMAALSDDPAQRTEHNQFVQDILCPVCAGDGELANPDGDREGAVMCGRCNGSGRVLVA
jgi:hypothetical protein